MPGAQARLGEINALMASDTFWNNREQAQKLIDEANTLRGKTEPLLKAEKQLEDFHVMVELGEAEPAAAQPKVLKELEHELGAFFKELQAIELKAFLSGRHDRSNCIMSINAGAGGTESCDWANMLLRMYQEVGNIHRVILRRARVAPPQCASCSRLPEVIAMIRSVQAMPIADRMNTQWMMVCHITPCTV